MELLRVFEDCLQPSISVQSMTFGDLLDKILEAPEDSTFVLSAEEGEGLRKLIRELQERLSATGDGDEQEKAFKEFEDEHPGEPLAYILAINVHPEIARSYRMICVNLMAQAGVHAVYFADPVQAQRRAEYVLKAVLNSKGDLRKNPPLS